MKSLKKLAVMLSILLFGPLAVAQTPPTLTGDTKLSCEAILCLATATRPGECDPSVARYRSIRHKKLGDTLKARRNFLALCPVGVKDPVLDSLLDSQAAGEQYCDASLLNMKGIRHQGVVYAENGLDGQLANVGCGSGMNCPGWRPAPIPNVLPPQCQALANHPYTSDAVPRYVGTPELYGFWVPAGDYEVQLANYNAAIPEMKERKQREEDEDRSR